MVRLKCDIRQYSIPFTTGSGELHGKLHKRMPYSGGPPWLARGVPEFF